MTHKVELARLVRKQLERAPGHIVDKLETWIDGVERVGLEEMRKIPGYHDEPLKGRRMGERSIRLSRSYRAIYVAIRSQVEFVEIKEVTKHGY